MFKTCLAMRVVDKKNPLRNAQRNTREYLYEPTAVTQENVAQWIGRDPNVLDIILKQHSQDRDTLIRRIETTGTKNEDAEDEPLDEEERKQVREEIQQGSTKQRGRMANAAMSSLNLSAATALAATRGGWPNGRAMGPPAATQGASRPNGVGGSTPAMRDVQLAPKPPAAAPPPASAPVQRQHFTPAAQSGFRPLPPGE
ncbi:hypothetical protein LTR02_017742 [Friedmanniomyces endolithicus]|nr:hypothetical protein LTR02_017742 [Friedmanniomyces endolithicus]